MGNVSTVKIDPLGVVLDKHILLETETRPATWRFRAAPEGQVDFLAVRDGSILFSGIALSVPREDVVRLGHHPRDFNDIVWVFCRDEENRDFQGDRQDVVGTMNELFRAILPGSPSGVSYMYTRSPVTLSTIKHG